MFKPQNDCHFNFFQNRECEYFPCHETAHPEEFNCLFCYCPLYALGKNCGGNFVYKDGHVKDCSNCLIPHRKNNYAYVTQKYEQLVDVLKLVDGEPDGKK